MTIKITTWIGVYNNTLPWSMASNCHSDYCNSTIPCDLWFFPVPGVLRYVADHTCDACSAGCFTGMHHQYYQHCHREVSFGMSEPLYED